jgi:hypothetical protein
VPSVETSASIMQLHGPVVSAMLAALQIGGGSVQTLFKAVTASIVHTDPSRAGADVAQELLDEFGGAPDLVLMFVSAALTPQAVLDGFYSVMPAAVRVVGCSSYAEINNEEALTHSVTAMGFCLGPIEARVLRGEPGPARALGEALGDELAGWDPSLLIVLPDVLTVNIAELLKGLQDRLGRTMPIIGGAPADMGTITATHQFRDREVFPGGVVALALKGPLRVATAAFSGYTMFGSERTITRVDGVKIREIDGQSAGQMYRDALGPRADELPGAMIEHPLGVVGRTGERRSGEAAPLIRIVFGVQPEDDALVLGADVTEGTVIRMTRGSRDNLLAAASIACREVAGQVPRPTAALVFDCISRKVVLGSRYKEEIRAAFADIPDDVPRIGFYTFGEVCPVDGVAMHHESTFTLAFLVVDA